MSNEERTELSLAAAGVLYVNGQATDQVVAAIRRLTSKLGMIAALGRVAIARADWRSNAHVVRRGESVRS